MLATVGRALPVGQACGGRCPPYVYRAAATASDCSRMGVACTQAPTERLFVGAIVFDSPHGRRDNVRLAADRFDEKTAAANHRPNSSAG